jgi:filamentous hemagglutinin
MQTFPSQVPASPVPNRGGSITGRSISIDTHRQALNNTQGTIAATQALTLQTGALNNDAGLIQAGSALVMDTHGQQMTNTHAAAYAGYAGAAGGITAQGALTLSSGDFNNSAGLIAAKGTFSASTAQVSNSGGQMAGQAGVSFTSTGFDNQNGQLQALGDININAGTGTLSNSGGLIRSAGSTSVLGASINNSNTLGTDQGIEGSNVSLTANTLANNSGAILADNNASFTSAGSLNNSAGLISAGNSASLTDSSASKTLAIANSAGTLIAGQNFGIAAASLGGDGKLLSKGSLSLDLSADFNNSGELTANGNASVRTTASISNSGTLQAGNTLSLAAANINNSATGIINAGTTKLNASTALVNRGLIDGVDTQINAGTLSNIGTGRIYGNTLSIAATTLSNDAETTGATLAARTRLDIGATNITNRGHALIFSAGDMAIGASLDANRQAAGQAASLNNASATIEALGNLDINAAQVRNTNEHFLYDTPLASIETRREDPSGRYYFIYERRTYTPVATSSDPAKILAGGTIRLNANSTYNYASHIVAGAGLNVTGAAITNADVQAPQSVVDSGTTYTLVHYPQTGNCGFIKWNCRRARDEWVTGPYSNSSQSTVAVSQPSPATGSNTQLTGAASTSVTANLSAAGSANAQARQAGIVEVPVNIASSTVTTSAPVAGATGVDGARSAQVNAQTQTIDAASPVVIRTSTPNTTIPNTSLFKANPNPAARYFVETDPRFASYKTWLGSDYMLTALALDPNVMQKRLGDGFYEQRLIREQVAKLTGQRFLGDYSNDDQQYQALMDDGITYARAHNLRPGIALSAAQMAQLTSDIVWLVEQTVTLPDGTQAKALVPQVYARVRQGDLDGTGALMAGKSVNINISGELINSATIAGKSAGKSQNAVNISANNALNTGRITGDAVTVVAANDLNNIGGRIDAASSLNVIAGRDLNVISTSTSSATQIGASSFSRTSIDRIAGLYVTNPGGALVASAGRDVNIQAGVVSNTGQAGQTTIAAAGNINLTTLTTAQSANSVRDARNFVRFSQSQEVGSQITTQGNLSLNAGANINATAANIQSQQSTQLSAAGNVNLTEGLSTRSLQEAQFASTKGFMSSRSFTSRVTEGSTQSIGTNVGGNTVNVTANQDINIKGSSVIADKDATLKAGNNVNIESATNTASNTSFVENKQSGFLSGGGFGISYGKREQSTDQKNQNTTAAASTVGAIGGNVNINAGQTFRQVG